MRQVETLELQSLSLIDYVRQCWHVVEPSQYVHGWCLDAIAEHLEAVTSGEITRLNINVPPGMMKSLLIGVFWPSWEWGVKKLAHYRYVCASHMQTLSIRDNVRMRRLVQSDWYQARFGKHVTLTKDQNAKIKFENSATGFREALAAGSITGSRGDRVIVDDSLSVEDARSKTILDAREEWFLEAVPTRLNSPEHSAILNIQQRLHERDTTGIAIAKNLGYECLILPMEFEPHRRCVTSIGFKDPRTEEGELLFPERFPRETVERDKQAMGQYAVACQFQQRPAPREGGIFKIDQVGQYEALPPITYKIQSWDTAFKTKRENDYSVCTTWGVYNGGFYLIHRYKAKIEYPELKKMMLALWKEYSPLAILVEDKASGQSLIQEMKRPIQDPDDIKMQYRLPIKGITPDVDKEARANAITTVFETITYIPKHAPWKTDFLDNLAVFPNGAHDDDVDSLTQALLFLSQNNRPKSHTIDYFGR